MKIIAAFVSSLLFGLGLVVSGLIDPAKVLGFLDVAGNWDPSLALTMAAAIVTTALGYRLAFAKGAPMFERSFQLPAGTTIDARLIAGASLFGIGWGLVGYCPGPAVAGLASANRSTAMFVLAMVVGMAIARAVLNAQQDNPKLTTTSANGGTQ
jgi:uncharacterized membrane protein YedE/YeeE